MSIYDRNKTVMTVAAWLDEVQKVSAHIWVKLRVEPWCHTCPMNTTAHIWTVNEQPKFTASCDIFTFVQCEGVVTCLPSLHSVYGSDVQMYVRTQWHPSLWLWFQTQHTETFLLFSMLLKKNSINWTNESVSTNTYVQKVVELFVWLLCEVWS